MEDKSTILLNSLLDFYSNPDHASSFEELLNKNGGLSLRMLDWFVTDYAKEKKIIYKKKNGKQFFVHVGYKSGLKGYQKKFFDPFCRTTRIDVNIGKSLLTTTIAQLNFVKWCIQNQVIDYIVTNKQTLQEQMRTKNKMKDSNKNGRGTQEISNNTKLSI
jgi:hypothetical protein